MAKPTPTQVLLGVGSNVGDRHAKIDLAVRQLDLVPKTKFVRISPVYETAPVGPVAQGSFLNACIEIQTELSPAELLTHLARIEGLAGRLPRSERTRWGPRELDLDILLFGDVVLQTETLTVPHPLMHERWFVLKPLADIAPYAMHPVLKKTVIQLLETV